MEIGMNDKIIEKTLLELKTGANDFIFPRWADFPSVGLYMDQVTELINGYLSKIPAFSKTSEITGSMINNYVKSGIMPAPVKKRYSKEHLAYIMVICTLKQTFNISTIKELLRETFGADNTEKSYDLYASDFENSCKDAVSDVSSELKNGCGGAEILKLMSQISVKKYIAERLSDISTESADTPDKKGN